MKNRLRKFTAVVLAVLLLLLSLPTGVFAASTNNAEPITIGDSSLTDAALDTSRLMTTEFLIETDETISAVGADKALERGHIARVPEKEDDLNTVVFVNSDGTYTRYLFDYPVKYETSDGKIRDVSLEVVSDDSGGFKSKEGNVSVAFSKSMTDGIALSGNDVSLKMKPAASTATLKPGSSTSLALTDNSVAALATVKQLDEKTVSYTFDSKTALEYQLTYTGFKEDIVVSEYTGQTEYHFLLETGGLTLTDIDGSYYLTDENGIIKATIGDIIIFTADEKNNTLGSMTHTVVKEDQQYILTIHVDAEYLSDENTKYPIRIDPTVEICYDNNGAGAIEDVTICSDGSYSGTSGSLYIGNRSDKGLSRALIKFPGLDFSSLGNIEVQSAYVEIRDLMCESTELELEARVFAGNAWSESGTTTWANVSPDASTELYSYNLVSYARGVTLTTKHRYSFEITGAVTSWKSGFYDQSKGIIIQAVDDYDLYYAETYIHKTFASYNRASNKPSLVVNYADNDAPEPPYGWLDWVTSTYISGWAYRPDIPNTPINVRLYITDTATNTTAKTDVITADQYRSDVHEAGFGNGAHGFTYYIDWSELNPGLYSVTAFGIGGDGATYALHGNPITYANEGLKLETNNVTLNRGDTYGITAYLYAPSTSEDSVNFTSDNSNIASVEPKTDTTCTVLAVNPGTTTIRAYSESGNYQAQCTVTVLKSAIIIVPGIMGTELALASDQNGLLAGTKVWPPVEMTDDFSNKTLLEQQIYSKMMSLQCDFYGDSMYDLTVLNHDNYGAWDQYQPLYDSLYSTYNMQHDIIFFGYDWRQSNSISGELLSNKVNQYDKVTIVAHSMGGLVASHMLTNASAKEKVVKLITLGTPFLGSIDPLPLMSHGSHDLVVDIVEMLPESFRVYFQSLIMSHFQFISLNLPSMYELYPTEQFFTIGNRNYFSVENLLGNVTTYDTFSETSENLPIIVTSDSLLVFNSDLYNSAMHKNNLLWNETTHITSSVNTYYISGESQETEISYTIDINILSKPWSTAKIMDGDNTVLTYSASINDMYSSKTYYVTSNHMALAQENDTINFVKKLINNGLITSDSNGIRLEPGGY